MNSAISFLSVLLNEKISSMNLFHSRGLVLLRFSISVSTADTKGTLAYSAGVFLVHPICSRKRHVETSRREEEMGRVKRSGEGAGSWKRKTPARKHCEN